MAKAWEITEFNPDMPLADGLEQVLKTRLEEMLSYRDGVFRGDAGAVHDMRVSCRRLLSMLGIFKDCFPRKKYKHQRKRLKELAGALGRVRECDVLLDLLRGQPSVGTAEDRRALDLLSARYAVEREEARRDLLRLLDEFVKSGRRERFLEFAGMITA